MNKYLTCANVHTGCKRRPRFLWPENVVIELDSNHQQTKIWLSKRWIKLVDDNVKLTESKVIKDKMRSLIRRL